MAIDKTICSSITFNSPIEIKTSRANTPVPVVDGIHLHSIYDPGKEAVALITKYENSLAKQNKVLVLGLAFGYHIWQLESVLGRCQKNWEIIVIEPDIMMVEEFKKYGPVEFSNKVRIITANSISEFYDDIELVRFMAAKPLVVPHAASFNLREDFFKKFMSYTASTKLIDVASKVKDASLRDHLLSLANPNDDFDHVINTAMTKNKLSAQDHFIGIFKELTAGAQQ